MQNSIWLGVISLAFTLLAGLFLLRSYSNVKVQIKILGITLFLQGNRIEKKKSSQKRTREENEPNTL